MGAWQPLHSAAAAAPQPPRATQLHRPLVHTRIMAVQPQDESWLERELQRLAAASDRPAIGARLRELLTEQDRDEAR